MSRNPVYIKLINSKKWKELRRKKLLNSPLCETCQLEGKSTLATEVHHITPVESVPTAEAMERLMFNYNNLQSLCHPCHANIHQQMFSHSKEAVKTNNRRATERFIDKFLK
ncbi:HNH endonuclease [Parabacteroides pacaensis]|uniref:HNH endonuclease n=1 Tax=Parabacteroides pacaensis TaxID=2086575 RepID=UPI000D0F289B|nr:HNH endonuclease signature motif containing protein [Parabacteroides pacaensis]